VSAWVGTHADQKGIEEYTNAKPAKKPEQAPDEVRANFMGLAAFMSKAK